MDALRRNALTRPTLIYAKPTTCHWCGGSLRHIRNVYKGKDSERYYDNETCLMRGEDRALRYRATLAGTVSSPWYIGLAGILIIFMLAFTFTGGTRAWAQEHRHHSPYHDFYKHWQQPIESKSSCCNARFNEKGEEVGDCEAVPFILQKEEDGTVAWWAFVKMVSRWMPVPENKIIREKNPDESGVSGHICYSRVNGVLCAVPPTGAI